MKADSVLLISSLLLGCVILCVGDSNADRNAVAPGAHSKPAAAGDVPASTNETVSNSTGCNGTDCPKTGLKLMNMINENRGMLLRTLYVLIGVTAIIVLYFVVRTIRIRRRKSKTKKYGVISTPANDLEMAPLDDPDDDDEDMTVFEVNGVPK